jgi:hypothetical protein
MVEAQNRKFSIWSFIGGVFATVGALAAAIGIYQFIDERADSGQLDRRRTEAMGFINGVWCSGDFARLSIDVTGRTASVQYERFGMQSAYRIIPPQTRVDRGLLTILPNNTEMSLELDEGGDIWMFRRVSRDVIEVGVAGDIPYEAWTRCAS